MKFSLFCSGNSLNDISDEEIKEIKKHTITMFLNYAPARFDEDCMDFLFWRDKEVTSWLKKQYAGKKPPYRLITMEQGLRGNSDFRDMVTVHENTKKDLNYSLTSALDMIFGLYPDATVYLFGHDMDIGDTYTSWYDEFVEKPDNGNRKNAKTKLPQQLEMFRGYRIYNCNMKTKCTVFPKVQLYDHLGVSYVR